MSRFLALLLVPLLSASGCVVTDDGWDDHHYYDDDDYYGDGSGAYACGDVERGIIDVGGALDSPAAEAVGVFVEYQGDGRWFLYTTCDTDASGYECEFDIVAAPLGRSPVYDAGPDDLERDDRLTIEGDESVHVLAYTARDYDGFYLETDPGAGLSLDVVLDRECGNEFVYWIGDGGIHRGAPSNPFELEPAAP